MEQTRDTTDSEHDWQPGDGCAFAAPDYEDLVRIYGIVEAVVDDIADVIELHATHRLWGGSNLRVGTVHSIPTSLLMPHTLQPFEERRWADIKKVR